IRTPLEVRRANALCDGNCRFSVTAVGAKINLTITQLRRHTTYYYVVVARDNVTARLGPRSRSIRARTP
ncbi:MAG: hypothetical protein H0W96_05640, partial [Solirubrobacterales bacterium]|nr:hypothetical protein [Solirubrobacterales bacterium]